MKKNDKGVHIYQMYLTVQKPSLCTTITHGSGYFSLEINQIFKQLKQVESYSPGAELSVFYESFSETLPISVYNYLTLIFPIDNVGT